MGSKKSARALENPHEYPFELQYLHMHALRLYGRSGWSEHGAAPLSEMTLAAYCARTGTELTAEESDGLFELDSVLRHPGTDSGTAPKEKA